jgi:hypothetical protein
MPTGFGPVLGTSHVPATCHFRPTSGANAVTARTFLARGEATPGQQQPRGQGGPVKPLFAYALGSLLAASSRKPAQEIRARNAQFGTVRNFTTAARERPQETAGHHVLMRRGMAGGEQRKRHGKFHGRAGKAFCGVHMQRSAKTVCWRWRQGSCSMDF